MFASLTIVAFLLRVFGLEFFHSDILIKEPPHAVQAIVRGLLKAFELAFIYRILTRKNFLWSTGLAVAHVVIAGFIPVGWMQSAFDLVLWVAVPMIFRKDRLWTLADIAFLYGILTLYAALSLIGKFGELESSQVHSFYKAILSLIDYKFFIVTVFAFSKYKGGIKIWKIKKKFLQM